MELFASQPRERSLFRYAKQFDSFAETQQRYAELVPDLAAECGQVAFLFLRAYQGELRDPEPSRGSTAPCCPACIAYMALPSEAKPPMRIESVQARWWRLLGPEPA